MTAPSAPVWRTMESAPRPWRADLFNVLDATGRLVAKTIGAGTFIKDCNTAALIVAAVNALPEPPHE